MRPAPERRTIRGQGGFALTLTLGLMLLVALTIGALFGLLSLTVRTTRDSEVRAREARAADAAVEAAIVQLRHEPDACSRSSQTIFADKVFDQGTESAADDVEVSVECEPLAASGEASDQVRIVGADGYRGKVKWSTDCSGSKTVPECTPWSAMVGAAPFGLAASRPGLVHTGPESLRFASGVTVRTGTAALGSSPAGDGPAKPAVMVGGEYSQGSPGLKLDSADDPGPQGCGILARMDAPSSILDADGSPSCDDPAARAVASDPTGFEADSGLVAPKPAAALPSSCPAGAVIRFDPGVYNAAKVASLNALFDGSKPACRNKTFWFAPAPAGTPGIYSFDAPSLNFADPTSSYVFGSPLGWDPVTGVPTALAADAAAPLCDQAASGSSIVLSARTAIRHSAGRFAVCPAFVSAGQPYPAIYQTTSVPSKVSFVTTLPRTVTFNCNLIEDPKDWDYCYPARNVDLTISAEGSEPIRSLRVLVTGTEGDSTPNNLISRRTVQLTLMAADGATSICSTGQLKGTPNSAFTLSYELLGGTCATKLKDWTGAQLDGLKLRATFTFTRVYAGADQSLTITAAETQLNALAGTLDPARVTSPTANWTGLANIAQADIDPDHKSATLAEPIMGCSKLVCQVPLAKQTRDPLIKDNTARYEMDIAGGFSFPELSRFTDRGVDPRIDSLRVEVDLATAQKPLPIVEPALVVDARYFRVAMNVRLELQTPAGTRCVLHEGGVNGGSSREVQRLSFSVDDLDDLAAKGACNRSIRTFEELTDPATKLKLAIDMPCVPNPDPRANWLCFQELLQDDHIWAVRPPSIDRVAISATTDSFVGDPANSEIAIDAAAPAPRKMFRSFGRTWLPLTDLDIHWKGDGGMSTLFDKDLVLHGLGSDMTPSATTAVVCCGKPKSRELRLRATIGGNSRLVATVRYQDNVDSGGPASEPIYQPGAKVDVLDWRRGRLVRD